MFSSPANLTSGLPRRRAIVLLIAVSVISALGCSTQMHYYDAKTFYMEEDYEAALRSVDLALQAKPNDKNFLLLRSDIILALYRSHGLPAIAFHHLSRDETNTISYMDSLHKQRLLMNEIRVKFTVPIVMRFSDNVSEAARELVRSTVTKKLSESCAHGFCELDLVEHPDSLPPVVLEILLEGLIVTQTEEEARSIWSAYQSGVRMETNPGYVRQVAATRHLLAWQQQLIDLQIEPDHRRFWDVEHFVVTEQLQDVTKRVEESKKRLAKIPPHVPRPVFTAYQFMEKDHVLDLEMSLKYRLVDLCHETVWKEEVLRYEDTNRLTEISNVHPDDPEVRNREITDEDIEESLSTTQEKMYSQFAEKVEKEIARIFCYRARDYQTLGFHAEAWEHYYVFLKTLDAEGYDASSSEAKSIVDQDPLKFTPVRGMKIPSDREPPTMEIKEEGVRSTRLSLDPE